MQSINLFLRSTRLFEQHNWSSIFQGPCNGDSGGPLYTNGQKGDNGDIVGRTIAGVVSGGIGCGGKSFENYPQWFARVSLFH